MGLTSKGWQRRTYDDILNDKIRRAKELFGEEIDVSDLNPLGKFIRINAYDQAKAEEEIEAAYYARFPNTASGQNLDRLLVFAGITRNPAVAAVYKADVLGVSDYVIPAGFLVGTDTDITYWTTQEYTINAGGMCTIEVSCTETGTIGNLSNPSAISKVVNPDANVSSVEGVECLTSGRDEESDADLRVRFAAAISSSGSSNENAIKAALLRVPTVQYAAVIENDTDETDADGRPPHSFECYVMGGDDYPQEIAEAIHEKRPIGIAMVGDKTVEITDASGSKKNVKYSPAPVMKLMVRADIKTGSTFPSDGTEQIKGNIIGYINSLGIGKTLVLSALYGHIYRVPGVEEVSALMVSLDDGTTYTASNVSVPEYGVIVCSICSVYNNVEPLVLHSVTGNMDSAVVGTTITWTADASGGLGTIQYVYTLLKDNAAYETIPWSDSNVLQYTFKEAGTYKVQVRAKDADENRSEYVVSAAIEVAAL